MSAEHPAVCTCARLSGDPGSYPCPVHPEFGAATVAGPVKSESAGRPLPAPGMTDLMVTPEAIDAYLEKEPYAATPSPPFPGMIKTEYGWARPCAACGSTNFGKPCAKAKDGFHV